METFKAIYGRRSIREFAPGKKIPEDVVRRIIESASYAPSVPLTPPVPPPPFMWRIIIVRGEEVRNLVADAALEATRLLFGSSFETIGAGHYWYMPPDTRLRVAEYTTSGELWEYPRDADIMFVPAFSNGGWVDTISTFTPDLEIVAHLIGFPQQNMWLVAHKYGIGAGYNAVPFADVRRREVLSEPLGIPLSWSACGGFCFSYPKIPRWFGPSRPSIEGMVDSEYWGVPYRRMAFRQTNYEEANIPETDIEEVIRDLNIVEDFEEGPIPGQMIEKVLDAGIWGPVPENLKAYRFILVKSKETKELIAKMAAEKKHESWTFNWAELQYGRLSSIPAADRVEKVEEIFATEPGRWLAEADALIIVLSGLFNWIDYPYAGLLAGPNPPLSVATGCCVQNMMIAASALGLGINYDVLVVGDERCRDILVEYLGIPAVSWMPLGILGLGKPGRKVKMPPRPPLENLFFDEYWGKPYLPEGITE